MKTIMKTVSAKTLNSIEAIQSGNGKKVLIPTLDLATHGGSLRSMIQDVKKASPKSGFLHVFMVADSTRVGIAATPSKLAVL